MKKMFFSLFLCTIALLLSSSAFAERAVLLVSLGMPDNTLKAYLIQANTYQIPVVIRGLYTKAQNQSLHPYVGSFKDTAERVKQLIGKSNKGGISIDPSLFRSFGIEAVPALVIYDETQRCLENSRGAKPSCPENSFDVVFGNLPIQKQLEHIVHQSKAFRRSDFANDLLVEHARSGHTNKMYQGGNNG